MSEAIDRAVELLKARIAEIDEEETQLQRSLTNLNVGSARKPTTAIRTPKRRRPKKRAKKGQRLEEVGAILKANPKAKAAEIARQIGISSNQVSGLRKQILASGEFKTPARKQKPKQAKRKTAKASKASRAKAAKK